MSFDDALQPDPLQAGIRAKEKAARAKRYITGTSHPDPGWTGSLSFSKQHIEDSMSAFKAVLGARSFQEAWEVQSDFAKTALDSYISQASKLNEMWMSSAKQAAEPLNARFAELAEAAQNLRTTNPWTQAAE